MKPFYGTKRLNAKPMTRQEYNTLRGWTLPADENPNDEGYLVEYTDGGKANVDGFAGYVSWSPKDVFEASYQPINALSFGHALIALKDGKKVARAGWNGKGMFLVLQPATVDAKLRDGSLYEQALKSNICTINAHIDMKTATGEMQPGWLASQTDMLANDWQIVD
jgi:hypothetical protein